MEPDRFSYSPIVTRPRIVWPGGARVALWVVPNVEHYEYQPREVGARDPWPRMPHPDVLGYGGKDYGNRVGLWRMFEVMDRLGLTCTASLSISVYEHYPEIMEAIEGRGWDVMCHGIYNTRYLWDLPEDEERAVIADCVETYRRLTGKPLAGWFSPAVSCTVNTPDLVAEAGFTYYCDFYHDDQPTPVRVRRGQLVSVPYTMDLNDAFTYTRYEEGEEFAQMVIDHFDTVYREGAEHGRVMSIALHPYMMGRPHRIKHLERALDYILSHDGVWAATGAEIARWYIDNAMTDFRSHLGAEA